MFKKKQIGNSIEKNKVTNSNNKLLRIEDLNRHKSQPTNFKTDKREKGK